MKILAIAVALATVCVGQMAVACPACNTRVGQPMVLTSTVPMQPRHHHHHLVRRPMGHHHARPAYVPWAMPAVTSGCSSCGSACAAPRYIARPCGCGSPTPIYSVGCGYASTGCGSTGCGSTGCGSTGCGSVGYGSVGYGRSYGSTGGGIRRCVPVVGPNGQTVMRCYRLIPVPKGTPGALSYQQVLNMTQGGAMAGYGSSYGTGAYGAGSMITPY